MTYNKEELLSLLSSMDILSDFSEDNANYFYQELDSDIKDKFQDFAYGASKFVLIPDNYDFVIKIPFKGTYYHTSEEDWDEDGFERFIYADSDNGWDYCEAETKRYELAENKGFNQFLAKTELLGYINDYPVYIQEKCVIFSQTDALSYHSNEEKSKTIATLGKRDFWINIDWLTDVRLYYGEDAFWFFINFIRDEEWDDLREDNIGYIGSQPVLVDYSGYYE